MAKKLDARQLAEYLDRATEYWCKEAAAELRRLSAENEALRKDAELFVQVQRACGGLPDGYEIQISLENGAGWVDLYNPEGDKVDFDADHEQIAQAVSDAINLTQKR